MIIIFFSFHQKSYLVGCMSISHTTDKIYILAKLVRFKLIYFYFIMYYKYILDVLIIRVLHFDKKKKKKRIQSLYNYFTLGTLILMVFFKGTYIC